jgi:hypothetical protein
MVAFHTDGYGGEPIHRFPPAMPKSTKPRRRKKTLLRDEYPNRIAELSALRGLTYADIAERVRPAVHENTIARLAVGQIALNQDWMTRLAPVLSVTPAELIVPLPATDMRCVTVICALQAGIWGNTAMLEEQERFDVLIRDVPELLGLSLYAGEVRGQGMNQRYPPGAVVVISRLTNRPNEIVENKRYHVRVTRADGTIEESVRLLVRHEDGRYFLKHESSSPEFQEWLPLDGPPGLTVELVGRVRYAVHSED